MPDESVEVKEAEVGMAESYISTLKSEFDPERYHSDYREALEQLVEAKVAGLPMPEAEDEDEGDTAEVVDLVAALRASVDAAKARRGESARPRARTPKPAKKAAAKKSTPRSRRRRSPPPRSRQQEATTKKAAAKKTAAKKAPAKKSA